MYKTRWSSTVFPHPMTTDPSRTPAPARSALEFAALLPPDRVPWLWLKAGESKPNAPPLPRSNGSGVGQTSGLTVHGASGSVVLGMGNLQTKGPANRPTGGLPHPSTGAVTQSPCRQ